MSERGIPERWSAEEVPSKLRNASQFPKSGLRRNPGFQSLEADSIVDGRHQSTDSSVAPGADSDLPRRSRRSRLLKKYAARSAVDGSATLHPELPPDSGDPTVPERPKWYRRQPNWLLLAVMGALISGGLGFMGVSMLLKLPSAPNCPQIFWPMASATVRLHCAQVAASKQTVKDLLLAIALVSALPPNHELRLEINRNLEEWSLDILRLGDESFQAGKLQEAIATAKKIPANLPAHSQVEDRIKRWRSIWSEADRLYKEAEAELREQHFNQAFNTAVRLLNVGNNYWATVKYEQLKNRIETARADGEKLAKAESLARRGGSANLLEAIKLAEAIGASSYVYKDAREAISQYGRKMLDLAQYQLNIGDGADAIAIAKLIPKSTGLSNESQDFITLTEAQRSAWTGTTDSLASAIGIAQNISSDRPLYGKAQNLIGRWRREIEDLTHLERARELAKQGTVGDLTAAIAEAQLVPPNNPRAAEARRDVIKWRNQAETIEDRPILDRAEELASLEDITSLQAAIDEVSQIAPRRALYAEARTKIRNWTAKIQRIQDQPFLDQARALASNGNLPAAIQAAQQIPVGRALSGEAQATVNDWQGQIQARQNWQQARSIALQGTPEAFAQAIRLADRIPRTSPLRTDVNQAIAGWSQQILGIAQTRGEYDIPGGIAIARLVPPDTEAYSDAQQQIEVWQGFLTPEQ